MRLKAKDDGPHDSPAGGGGSLRLLSATRYPSTRNGFDAELHLACIAVPGLGGLDIYQLPWPIGSGLHATAIGPAVTAPSYTSTPTGLSVSAVPGAGNFGLYGGSADLVQMQLPLGAGDHSITGVHYGAIPGGTWSVFALETTDFEYQLTVPGATTPATFGLQIDRTDPISAIGASPVTPLVGPVGAPKIDNLDMFQPQTVTGASHVLSWQAPAVGSATAYEVLITRLDLNGTATAKHFIGSIVSAETTVAIPTGMLVSGKSYQIRIIALHGGLVAELTRNIPTVGQADVGSNLITVN